jgi:chromosome segregation ATPase
MTIDDLPDQLEAFLERARAVLNREIEKARKGVTALNGEKAKIKAELGQLGDQRKQAQTQLDAVLADLNRASGLVGLNHEIAEARKTLDALNAQKAEATKIIEGLAKERTQADHELTAMWSEIQALRTERSATVAEISKVKALEAGLKVAAEPKAEIVPFALKELVLPGVAGEIQDYYLCSSMQPSQAIPE